MSIFITSKGSEIFKINSSVLCLCFTYSKGLRSYEDSFNVNYLTGTKGRQPTRKELLFYTASFKKTLRTSLILSVMHVSNSILSLAVEVCYVPIGDEE